MSLPAVTTLLLLASQVHAQGIPVLQHLPLLSLELTNQVSPPALGVGRVVLTTDNSVFGSICPAGWNSTQTFENVRVICSMLGFTSGGSIVNNTFGAGNKNFLIEGLTCHPGDQTLNDCDQAFVKTCGPNDEELAISCNWAGASGGSNSWTAPSGSVPVVVPGSSSTWGIINTSNLITDYVTQPANCTNPNNIRLYSSDLPGIQGIGNGYVQYLNVTNNSTWEFLCDDKWSEANAKAVCAQLCFPQVADFIPRPGILADSVKYPQNGPRSHLLFECQGNESDLSQCQSSLNSGNCVPGQDALAGVQCLPANNTILNNALPDPDVVCGTGSLSISFPTPKFPPLTASNIQVIGNPPTKCVSMNSNANNFTVSVAINQSCAVSVTETSTEIIYSITVGLIWTSQPIAFLYINHRYKLNCSISKEGVVTNRFQPFTQSPISSPLNGSFDFNLRLELYQNNMFTKPLAGIGGTYLVEVGAWINAAVVMEDVVDRFKLVVNDCNAYAVMPVTTNSMTQPLIQKKCPQQQTLAMYPLDNHREGFRFKAFQFSGYSMVYLECKVTICLSSSQALECDRTCGAPTQSGRRRRQADGSSDFKESTVSSKTVLLYDATSPDFSDLLATLEGVPSLEVGVQGQVSAQVGSVPPGNTAGTLFVPTYFHACIAIVVLFAHVMMQV